MRACVRYARDYKSLANEWIPFVVAIVGRPAVRRCAWLDARINAVAGLARRTRLVIEDRTWSDAGDRAGLDSFGRRINAQGNIPDVLAAVQLPSISPNIRRVRTTVAARDVRHDNSVQQIYTFSD